MVHCRLLHVTLLVFNSVAVRSLSVISGGKKSTFSREENANALILVASQVKIQSVFSYFLKIYEMSFNL
jgi:sodium/bile acid cotransporter 7